MRGAHRHDPDTQCVYFAYGKREILHRFRLIGNLHGVFCAETEGSYNGTACISTY